MHTPGRIFAYLLIVLLLAVPTLRAQSPATHSGPLVTSASAGLALTSGNKDTSTLNLGYELVYDPKARNLAKSDGLVLRGKSDGELTADRLSLNARDEYRIHSRVFTFGQLQYARDQFKNIQYLVSPAAGIGYRFADSPKNRVSADAGLGGVWEKPLLQDVRASGAVTLGEKLTHQLSPSATLSQSFSALYKSNDFSDSLYTFGAAVAASMTARTQLKVELLDTYKNVVAPSFVKNDVALIVSMVFKH